MASKHHIKQQQHTAQQHQHPQHTFGDGDPFNYEELNVIGTGKWEINLKNETQIVKHV